MLVGLLSFAGGWAGLAIGGVYGWASWTYSYNREAWMNDAQVKQAHVYQYDQLQITAHSIAREEVRDRTQAKITKLSNYILVTTLVLALAAEMLVEGQIPPDCADFVLNVYMLCLGSAMLYLVLSILFGVAASNVVYERSAELLTDKVPPPWQIIDERMRRRKAQELTKAFEKRPWKEMFMPPLMRHPKFGARIKEWRISKFLSRMYQSLWSGTHKPGESNGRPASIASGDEYEPLATNSRPAPKEVSEPIRSRMTCSTVDDSRPSVAEELRHATIWEKNEGFERDQNMRAELLRDHAGCKPGVERHLHAIREDYLEVWVEFESLWAALLRQSGLCASLGFKNLLEAYGYYSMATLYGAYGSQAWAFWAVQIIFTSLNAIIMQFIFRFENRWRASLVSLGPLCCAVSATTFWAWLDRVLVPLCYVCHFLQSCQTFFILVDIPTEGAEEEPNRTMQTIAEQMKLSQGLLCETAEATGRKERPREFQRTVSAFEDGELYPESPLPGTRRAHRLTHLDEENWTDDAVEPEGPPVNTTQYSQKNSRDTAALASQLMRGGRLVVTSLWCFSVLWAIRKSVYGIGFRNSMAVLKMPLPAGPPVAGVMTLGTNWPSPYFKPRSVVCPKGRVFIGDEFRVFELQRGSQVVPYPCDVDGRIADVAADCNETDCWPVILVENRNLAVLDCSTGSRRALLQARAPAERFAQADHMHSYAAHNGQVVEYLWSSRRNGWAPQWTVAEVGKGTVQAMDVVADRLLIFSKGIVEVRNLESGKVCGTWNLPQLVFGAGCAFDGARAVLLLGLRPGAEEAGNNKGVELMCAELRGPQDCESEAGEEPNEGKHCLQMLGGGHLALPRDNF